MGRHQKRVDLQPEPADYQSLPRWYTTTKQSCVQWNLKDNNAELAEVNDTRPSTVLRLYFQAFDLLLACQLGHEFLLVQSQVQGVM